MELRKFISEALSDIIGGVEDAQKQITKGEVVPITNDTYKSVETGISGVQTVEFEVAVTTQEKSGSEAKLNVVAAVIGGGVSGHSGASENHASRLKFRIPIRLPNSEVLTGEIET